MKTQFKKISTALLLFFVVAYARAGFLPIISSTLSCQGNDATLILGGTGVAGPYSVYLYNPATGYYFLDQNVAVADTIPYLPAGTYQFEVYPNNDTSLMIISTLTISSLVNIQATVTPTTCPANAGSIAASVSGGTAPYTYLWSNSVNAAAITNLPGGPYSLTVTDANGCTAMFDTVVVSSSSMTLSISNNGIICAPVLTAVETGGATPVTYSWNNGATTASITGFSGYNNYWVTATDANGCTATQNISIYATSLVIDSGNSVTLVEPTSCGGGNGSISINMQSGTAPYSFIWSNSATGNSVTNLTQGVYVVTVTDAHGCSGVDSFYLYNVPFFIDSSQNANIIYPTTCNSSGGSITVAPYNGSGPFTYAWSNGGTDSTISNLTIGTYSVTVTDAHSCTASANYYLGQNTLYAGVSVLASPTCATNNGSIQGYGQEYPYGGGGTFTYQWSIGATTPVLGGLAAGQYDLTVTDGTGCSASLSYMLNSVPLYIDSSSGNLTLPSCATNNGAISVTPGSGTPPYTYLWSNGATSSAVTGLGVGNYSVTVTDTHNCTGSADYYLYNLYAITAYINDLQNPSCGASDGSLQGYAYYDYTTGTPLNYLWSTGSTNANLTNVSAGTYSLTVTETNGCTASTDITLTGTANFYVSVTSTPTACDTSLHTGTATAIAIGQGTAPYTYEWYSYGPPNWQQTLIGTSQTITNLGANVSLTVQVTDANGCSSMSYDSGSVQLDPSCYDHITGYAFNDANNNCVHDAGEQGMSGAYIIATGTGGQYYYANPDSNGFYDVEVLPGTYTVGASFYYYGGCSLNSCVNSYTATFANIGQISSGNDFAVNSGSPTYNLGVHLGYHGSAPGQQREYWVYYYNWGLTSVANGVLTFVHDPNITLASTYPPYTSYDANTQTITWNIVNNLNPMNWLDAQHEVTMMFNIPSSLPLGTQLTAQANISPTAGDCDPTDNSEFVTDVVSASHDPNVKEVSPSGNLLDKDTVLTYTIRFQNTGNEAANLVIVSDTLSPYLDPATVKPGASSSPYTFSLSGNGILTFTFSPINLPDSTTSPDGSTGFITFTVHTRQNLVIGNQINNTAYIYFDANPAVVTNTTTSLRSNTSGIHELKGNSITARVVPNPAHEQAMIEFTGATGNVVLKISDELGNIITTANNEGKQYILDATSLAAGMYFYTAEDANGNRASGKISIVH